MAPHLDGGALICLVVSLVLFGMGAFSRWWVTPLPYYPAFISAGLFFWVLSILLPMILH